MRSNLYPSNIVKSIRSLLIIIGIGKIVGSIFADSIGFGSPGGFGGGQFLLLIFGVLFLLIGVLWGKFLNLYRWIAIIILNTTILFGALELGSIIISRLGQLQNYTDTIFATYPKLPYYTEQNWAKTYWKEARQAEQYRYQPYVVWSHIPFTGETVNVNKYGNRVTPNAACHEKAYDVFFFGGSTMWGWGSPDWGTIATYFQQELSETIDSPVCVINFGEDGFVSSQGLIELMSQLQNGNIPDVVIFYDGANDVFAGYESGKPGSHLTLDNTASKFEDRGNPIVAWLISTRSFSLFERLIGKLLNKENALALDARNQSVDHEINLLAGSITKIYLNNYRIVEALSNDYGFEFYFFWQPHLALEKKVLTEEERLMKSRLNPRLSHLTVATYKKIAESESEFERLWYLSDAFAEETSQIWIDEWGHVTPLGNQLVANEMLTAIDPLQFDW